MSYDIDYGPNERNVTFNIAPLLRLTPLKHFDELVGKKGHEVRDLVAQSIVYLESHSNRETLEALNPKNGVGFTHHTTR